MASEKDRVFQTAFDTYQGKEAIGNGGAGIVYRAVNERGEWAVKVLMVSSSGKPKRFQNECKFCLEDRHKGIIRVQDHGLWNDKSEMRPFYVMTLYDGSLRTLMKSGIDPEKVMPYFGQMLNAVEAAHLLGVVHRDIKPENFLHNGRTDQLVLADFGIAHFLQEDLYTAVETKAGERLANFQYSAPEQRVRGQSVDHRADIYALGLVLNEMFTGHIPQGTDYASIGSIKNDYQYLDALVAKMIQQAPEKRPQSVEEIKKELIGRKNEFISLQRLSELKKRTVVSVTDLDDPLVSDPPKIVNADWNAGRLTITLSRPVDERWHRAFLNMGNYSYTPGIEPELFEVHQKKLMIDVEGYEAQAALDHFKAWLPKANQVYEDTLRRAMKTAESKARRELEEKIARGEERQKVLSSLKI